MNIELTEKRIESKFITNNFGLNKFLWLIRNNGFLRSYQNRIVNSLYYDNLKFSSIKDNLAGITPRKKFRLRWYGDKNKDWNNYQFEKKIKLNLTGYKKILKFEEKIDIFSIDYSTAGLQKITDFYDQNLLPLNYNPQLMCSYKRQYFENSYSVRLTIDSDIKYWAVKNDIKNDLNKPSIRSNYNIVEIKFIPKQKDSLIPLFRKLPSPSTRCSKYLLGHAKLNKINYI
jgi:hypothetical protein